MLTTKLPRTEIQVSRLALGTWGLVSGFHWGQRDAEDSRAAMAAALDLGVTFWDTAEMYGDGASEALIGDFLAGGRRDEVVLATKMKPENNDPAKLALACEASLKRLRTDRIDLYQVHWRTDDARINEVWAMMLKLKEQGKIRAAGVCNFGVGDLGETLRSVDKPATNQLPYNPLWRAIEHEIAPLCRREEVGILVYSPLQQGLLSGKIGAVDDVVPERRRSRHFSGDRPNARHGEHGQEERTFVAVAELRAIATRAGLTLPGLAIRWALAKDFVTAVVFGVRDADQLMTNVNEVQSPLPDDLVHEVDLATAALNAALGPNPDMWQGESQSRFR
ncbi:MAG TPA: aldo/keto reductase [Pirellulaceae bacterium]|jgi:aryl-alcohol dehydrogenase-like predicted oxidoreductase|nr:aldo/keto reductase [Pirellulaceae bacterium]